MFRRLAALLLMLACACAPVLPALEAATTTTAPMDCCATKCACNPTDCATPPAAPVRAPLTVVAAVEQQTPAAKPAIRVARLAFAQFIPSAEIVSAPASLVRASFADGVVSAARVALFQAHCSLRL